MNDEINRDVCCCVAVNFFLRSSLAKSRVSKRTLFFVIFCFRFRIVQQALVYNVLNSDQRTLQFHFSEIVKERFECDLRD